MWCFAETHRKECRSASCGTWITREYRIESSLCKVFKRKTLSSGFKQSPSVRLKSSPLEVVPARNKIACGGFFMYVLGVTYRID